MKRSSTVFAGALAAVLLAGGMIFSLPVQAGSCPSQHPGRAECLYQSLTPEKQAQFDAIMKNFDQKTAPLRDKIAAKHIELKTLGDANTPDPKAIGKASEELVSLRNEFAKERQAMVDRVAKEIGINIMPRKHHGDCGGFGPGKCPGGQRDNTPPAGMQDKERPGSM